jgi:hypothetical protein
VWAASMGSMIMNQADRDNDDSNDSDPVDFVWGPSSKLTALTTVASICRHPGAELNGPVSRTTSESGTDGRKRPLN